MICFLKGSAILTYPFSHAPPRPPGCESGGPVASKGSDYDIRRALSGLEVKRVNLSRSRGRNAMGGAVTAAPAHFVMPLTRCQWRLPLSCRHWSDLLRHARAHRASLGLLSISALFDQTRVVKD